MTFFLWGLAQISRNASRAIVQQFVRQEVVSWQLAVVSCQLLVGSWQ
ncbi:hypothetical protein [Microcoleus anatoxicus]|uniref:Uncharacterized protein n=1 Tax=Microcoleus anatoxicus PTRS2 TaxID=2705321 RepID=A0ABU8YGZ5_9CYAN